MTKCIDLTGQKFGKLTVISRAENQHNRTYWKCVCDCGQETIADSYHLRHGNKKSCGCLTSRHGLYKHPLYSVWRGMLDRCFNPNTTNYNRYGGRGITICDEWCYDFKHFYDWSIAHGYEYGLSIDRIDTNGNYCPENCRWVDLLTQANNTRANRYLTWNGETHTMSEWSRLTGIAYGTIKRRLSYGWDIDRTLSTTSDARYRSERWE